MNLSLILIFVLILVVIPMLIRQLFLKEVQETVCLMPEVKPETTTNKDNAIETTRSETISDIIAASSGLLVLQGDAKENHKTKNIIQKELVFEKTITIKAPKGQNFMGYALLQSLQNAGLKFSSKGLFYYINPTHGHEQTKILYELSPSIEPYRFNLAEIGGFKTPGLILKIIEPAEEELAKNLAEILAEDLGGEVQY